MFRRRLHPIRLEAPGIASIPLPDPKVLQNPQLRAQMDAFLAEVSGYRGPGEADWSSLAAWLLRQLVPDLHRYLAASNLTERLDREGLSNRFSAAQFGTVAGALEEIRFRPPPGATDPRVHASLAWFGVRAVGTTVDRFMILAGHYTVRTGPGAISDVRALLQRDLEVQEIRQVWSQSSEAAQQPQGRGDHDRHHG